ncbi:MAG: ubiquinone biosynthesis accessory factor UbiJ [Saccharospirillum sp.]
MSVRVWPLQRLVNEALRYDPVARLRLASLDGKRLVLSMREPSLTVALSIDAPEGADSLHLDLGLEDLEPCDARVSGRAADLLAVLQASDRTAAMMAHQIDIQGDTRTFFSLQEVLADLDIDWEMALGDRLGDLPAHWLADGLRLAGRMARNHAESLQRTWRNYGREESGLVVPSSLWRQHSDGLYQLRLDADRLQARVKRLAQRIDSGASRE